MLHGAGTPAPVVAGWGGETRGKRRHGLDGSLHRGREGRRHQARYRLCMISIMAAYVVKGAQTAVLTPHNQVPRVSERAAHKIARGGDCACGACRLPRGRKYCLTFRSCSERAGVVAGRQCLRLCMRTRTACVSASGKGRSNEQRRLLFWDCARLQTLTRSTLSLAPRQSSSGVGQAAVATLKVRA